jgi:glycosyltransferase involved in cell wall biosynthesis
MNDPVDICIVTQLHLSSNPRVVKEADALSDAGYSVAVIAPDYSIWGREADKMFRARKWTVVQRPQFGPLSPPMTRINELARRVVLRTALKAMGVSNQTIVDAARHPVSLQLTRAAKLQPASLYVGHLAGLSAAAAAANFHSTKFAYDAEDFHVGDRADLPEHELEKRIIQAIESCYLPGAAYVTAASPMIAEAYVESYGIPLPTTILNVFPKRNASSAPTPRGNANPGPSLYWFSQTIGPGRGLETAIEAIGLARSRPHLYLRGTPVKLYADELIRLATRCGVGERLHLLDPGPPDELERLGSVYDLGYSGETGFSLNNTKALGNKLFSYILGGVPILASNIPSHCQIAPDFGAAMSLFPIGDAVALAAALDEFLLDPSHLAAARAHAWRLGQERYNWDKEMDRIIELVGKHIVQRV